MSPGDKQYALWWQQFRDVVLPHRHDHHQAIVDLRQGNTVMSSNDSKN
jgi:hypothetical protein